MWRNTTRRGDIMDDIDFEKSSGNVFIDLGFSLEESAVLTIKSELIVAVRRAVKQRDLTPKEAAKLCHADHLTFATVLRGQVEDVTIDQLIAWLTSLDCVVDVHVRPAAFS